MATWDAVTAAWDALGQPLQTADALVRSARAALSGADREAAATRLRRAAPIAERLGARPLHAEITALARRAGVSLAGEGDKAGEADGASGNPLGLTNREMEVLRLVAAGRSNRQIAGALFISPSTASVHVSNILSKLGAATRTEAAARAYALRLFEA